MNMRMTLVALVALLFATGAAGQAAKATAAGAKKPAAAATAKKKESNPEAVPLPAGTKAVASHAPYEAGECKVCHQNADPAKPGPIVKEEPALCLDCHEEFAPVLQLPHTHWPARSDCVACHNPHNSKDAKLLYKDAAVGCLECHDDIGDEIDDAPVKHRAVSEGRKCLACHDAHGAKVAKLLVKLPSDLCISCHNVDSMKGVDGKPLQNTKAWLDSNKDWHDPVKAKDCSACHVSHAGEHFRLLTEDYPKTFYAMYDPRTYALCNSCHKEQAYSSPKTTTLTAFRDGDNNLHYLHLNQGTRGRTCRACHEVHASTQPHHIRESVPYGSSGWSLKLNFRKTENGGSCNKTCHAEKAYSRVAR